MLKVESEEWLELFVFGVASAQHNPFFYTLLIYQEQMCMWTSLYPKKCWNSKFSKWHKERDLSWVETNNLGQTPTIQRSVCVGDIMTKQASHPFLVEVSLEIQNTHGQGGSTQSQSSSSMHSANRESHREPERRWVTSGDPFFSIKFRRSTYN